MKNTKRNFKIISFTNWKSGGKSSIARLLGEEFNTSILNFDKKRDSTYYNAITTINVDENKKVKRKDDYLELSYKTTEERVTAKEYLICDLGGYFDERIIDLESDIYIIPSFDDFESISETMKSAKFIKNHFEDAEIIFILNGAFIHDKKLKKEKLEEFEEHKEVNGFKNYKTLYLPHTKLMRKLVDEASKKNELKGRFEQQVKYKKVDEFMKDLIKEIVSK